MLNRNHQLAWLFWALLGAVSLLGQSNDEQRRDIAPDGSLVAPSSVAADVSRDVESQPRSPDGVNAAASLPAPQPILSFPTGITMDGSGNLWVSDAHTNTIKKITPAGVISRVAGTRRTCGMADGAGAEARFNQPSGLTPLASGSIVVADTANGTIRMISSEGMVTTLAGISASRGNDDGPVGSATFSSPVALGRDATDAVYVADAMNHTIRKVTAAGIVSTIAGSACVAGYSDGTGSAARFNYPSGIALDGDGNLYVADTTNNLIRKITSAGVVSTLAGLQNVAGYDDGTGSQALFNHPGGLAVDGSGNIYVADTGNSAIRMITPNGVVTTLAGLPTIAGLENGAGIHALFNQPQALAVDGSGNVYVADTGNATIRRIDVNRNVTTVALATEDDLSAVAAPASNLAPIPTLPGTE